MKGTLWCLHGAVGHAADWQGLSIPGWAVKRVDLWRFLDCCPMSIGEFGRALNEEARRTEGPNVLIGYSMGGRLALHALLEAGQPWDAAVIVSAHPGIVDESERATRRAADAEWGAKAIQSDWAEFLAEWNSQPVLGDPMPGMADRILLRSRSPEIGRSFIDWSLGAQEPLWDKLSSLTTPVLWICGEHDEKFKALGEQAVALIPGAKLAMIRSGHRVLWEAPEAFAEAVHSWLSESFGTNP
jgi:2-succinyl-6-hydroxy-2,4-cyclohexadiene-1-carboxylate synthase